PFNATLPNPSVSSSQTLLLQNSDGAITLQKDTSQPSSSANGSIVILQAQTHPSTVRVGEPFRINVTIQNNSTDTVNYSRTCSPSFRVSFIPHVVHQVGRPCNIMAVREELKPLQSTS